jgi:hypothetical protein
MFQDLDSTLKVILDDPGAPADLKSADVSFLTPEKNFAPGVPTVDLFLYEVKENRLFRDPAPLIEQTGNLYLRRQPPLRVDCTYLVTTWSNKSGALKVAEEHLLLGLAFVWLSRFGTIPASYLQGSLAGQPFPPPTLVAQLDLKEEVGEFWSALGIPPRPAFALVVTVAMDLGVQVPEGPPVVTEEIDLEQKGLPATRETTFTIAGTVRAANTLAAIAGAQVSIQELGRVVQTDADGHFTFTGLEAGAYTLRTAAGGFATQDKPITVPGPVLNAYDVSLTP